MSEDHDHGEVRSRLVGWIDADDSTHIEVDHVYDNSVCPEHGSLTSTGMVGLTLCRREEDGTPAMVLLDARDALLLADRLTRAAHLVLELDEDLPDVEREVLRHSQPSEAG